MQDVVVVVESIVDVVLPRTYSIRPQVKSSFPRGIVEDSIITMTNLLDNSINALAPPVLVG